METTNTTNARQTDESVDIDRFDLRALSDRFYADPYPYYRALRERAPLYHCPSGTVFLTRYADSAQVYRDAQSFSSDKTTEFEPKFGHGLLYQHHTSSLVFNDPPRHTRVRRLIVGALSARTVRAMKPAVSALVTRLLDRLESRFPDGRFDGIDDFAALIPVEVISNLLRIPSDEREPLRQWSLDILGALEPAITATQLERGERAVEAFLAYLRDLVAERRRHPNDAPDDILSRLIRGENGEQLDELELLHNCIFILNAGHETTTNLIGNGIDALLNHPEQLALLRAEPERIGDAIEEILRFESPNQLGNRRCVRNSVIGGETLPAGTSITIGIGAANRDPAQFDDPERFDIRRQANRHLAFGSGSHACAGLSVARLEGRIALLEFFNRFPSVHPTTDAQRNRRARFRGFATLPLARH